MQNPLYEVALGMIPGVGATLTRLLVSYCGSAEGVFQAPKEKLLKIPGIGQSFFQKFNKTEALQKAEKELKLAEKHETQILFYTNPKFPDRLKQLVDAPTLVYYKGTIDLNFPKSISIVGTRKPTDYGKVVTEKMVQDVVPFEPVIVSGLAYGIDIMAHRAAVHTGLSTIGVMASGMDILYPAAHRKTAEKMVENGGLLTEFGFGTPPDAFNFPSRNRIIAGLGDCTMVIESAAKGGTLITAELANSYHKEVMAVPGPITSEVSAGCNNLIKTQQAVPYTQVQDLVELLNWDSALQPTKPKNQLYDPADFSEAEFRIITVLQENKEEQIDALSWKTQLPMNQIASLLLTLEFRGIVRSMPGKKYGLTGFV